MDPNKVVSIDQKPRGAKTAKSVAANQKSIDELPLASGTWSVAGVPGLYIRCRVRTKSYFLQRKVSGKVVKRHVGELTLKRARAETMRLWAQLRPKPEAGEAMTLERAFEEYLEQKELAEKTREIYSYTMDRYLAEWKPRQLSELGHDRVGMRRLQQHISENHGKATWNQVLRLFSAVYRWQRRVDPSLPEPPTVAVDPYRIEPRDWALSPQQLQAWWDSPRKNPGRKQRPGGVKHLGPIKRAWWLVALFTGARKRSIESLAWPDVDLANKTIRFRVAKRNRPYRVPISDTLTELLIGYRESNDVPESDWLFPSTVRPGRHIVAVRDDNYGVVSPHHLRHSFRTTLFEIGATPDQARLLMGHSMGGDVSRGYITVPLVLESLRPVINAVAERYVEILGPLDVEW